MRASVFAGVFCLLLAGVSAAAAQPRPPASPPAGQADQLQARHEIAVLEGVLENAVQYGAQMLNRRLRTAASAPDMVLLSGAARARGFRLDGYGVFFDVEYPAVRRSVMWSVRTLDRPDPVVTTALQELRRNLQSIADPQTRQMLEQTLKLLEGRTGSSRGAGQRQAGATVAASSGGGAPSAAAGAGVGAAVDDPGAIYLEEVKKALVDALLEHAGPIDVAQNEWLTVAARESNARRLVPGDPGDQATTLVLRIRGGDLAALRKAQPPNEDARKRVEVREY